MSARIMNPNLRAELDEYGTRRLWEALSRERSAWLEGLPDRNECEHRMYEDYDDGEPLDLW